MDKEELQRDIIEILRNIDFALGLVKQEWKLDKQTIDKIKYELRDYLMRIKVSADNSFEELDS